MISHEKIIIENDSGVNIYSLDTSDQAVIAHVLAAIRLLLDRRLS